MEQEQLEAFKDHRSTCCSMWTKDILRLEDRFLFTDKALELQSKEIERRMHEANNLKKEFSAEMSRLKIQVGSLEIKLALWLKTLGIGLILFQIVVVIVMHVIK